MNNKTISTKEAAVILDVSTRTITTWANEGYFPGTVKLNPFKINSALRIPEKTVFAFKQDRKHKERT